MRGMVGAVRRFIGHHRLVVAYTVLALAVALAFVQQDREKEARERFDDRRAYEICLAGNESRALINQRFENLDKLLVSFSAPGDPRAKAFLESEMKAELPERDCEELYPVER